MNKKIAEFMRLECADGEPFHHIHATGSFGWRWMPDYVKELGTALERHPHVEMREFIYDMPLVMAAADLVICRAGAATISEAAASGTPCIMVPSPNVTGNHQEKTPACSKHTARRSCCVKRSATEKRSMPRQRASCTMKCSAVK